VFITYTEVHGVNKRNDERVQDNVQSLSPTNTIMSVHSRNETPCQTV